MINSTYLDEALTPEEREKLQAVAATPESNFVELAILLELDPHNDFRNANLSGVDFSNCDLAEFNFSGSDLRYCHGVNVVFPAIQNLDGADTRDSVFEYQTVMHEAAIQAGNRRLASSIPNYDPLSAASWIIDSTRIGSRNRDAAILLSLQNLSLCGDQTIISTTAYAARSFFPDKRKLRSFLCGLLSQKGELEGPLIACARLLVSNFPDDPLVISIVLDMIFSDERFSVKRAGLQLASRAKISAEDRTRIQQFILSKENAFLRRNMIYLAIRSNPERFSYLYSGTFIPDNVFDFRDPVTEDQMRRFLDVIVARIRGIHRPVADQNSSTDERRLALSLYMTSTERQGAKLLLQDLAFISSALSSPLAFSKDGKEFLRFLRDFSRA